VSSWITDFQVSCRVNRIHFSARSPVTEHALSWNRSWPRRWGCTNMIPNWFPVISEFTHWVSPLRAGVCGFQDNRIMHDEDLTLWFYNLIPMGGYTGLRHRPNEKTGKHVYTTG
jgi:hypothetical protein